MKKIYNKVYYKDFISCILHKGLFHQKTVILKVPETFSINACYGASVYDRDTSACVY